MHNNACTHMLFNLANFSNYVKGQQMRDALGDLFGHGIFVANGEGWKYQRKTASVLFNVANFRDHFTEYVYVTMPNWVCFF